MTVQNFVYTKGLTCFPLYRYSITLVGVGRGGQGGGIGKGRGGEAGEGGAEEGTQKEGSQRGGGTEKEILQGRQREGKKRWK